ncbi:MAG TPA: ribonuclease III [Clostridiales bacterium]|jgi:ribonuclease-3|nr:ribonuclease III [Clostridiales bacterium]HCG35050.1 ribonuclease III [Clostridiales bacterium]
MKSEHIYPAAFCEKAKELEDKIGYTFEEKEYLYEALTHSSYSNEQPNRKLYPCNERLEFLGDSVLSLAVSRYLFGAHNAFPEGELTRVRAVTVCENALYEYACDISLGDYLLLGKGEEMTDGRHRRSILADAFEALIAAVFLDGSLDAAEEFIMDHAKAKAEVTVLNQVIKDYKSYLQQLVQYSKGDKLDYRLAGESGPDHKKTFTVQVFLNSNCIGTGSGFSKRDAEQMAAKEALVLFGEPV